jgi:hypothetical protein
MSSFKQDHPDIASIKYNTTTKKYTVQHCNPETKQPTTVEQIDRTELVKRHPTWFKPFGDSLNDKTN